MLTSTPPFLGIVGADVRGATRLMLDIIGHLSRRGYRIGVMRQRPGAVAPGPEAGMYHEAGAEVFGAAEGGHAVASARAEGGQEQDFLRRAYQNCHLVLVDGGAGKKFEKIVMVPQGGSLRDCDAENVRAVVAGESSGAGTACFAPDDIAGICDFIQSRYLRPRLSAAIMAGGSSSRLGKNKALLELGGATIIEQVLRDVSAFADRIVLITNSPQEYEHLGLPMAGDLRPGCGPLSGIHAALCRTDTEYVLVKSCDIPLVTAGHLRQLCGSYPGHDITIFKTSQFQPLCAVYRRTSLPVLNEQLDLGEYRLLDLFPTLDVRVLRTDDEAAFRSVNTEEDYAFVQSEFEKRK